MKSFPSRQRTMRRRTSSLIAIDSPSLMASIANCTAVFADIRDSSALPGIYGRPALAKIYRAYLSEVVAIFNGLESAREINIAGDAVWAVVNTPKKPHIEGYSRGPENR